MEHSCLLAAIFSLLPSSPSSPSSFKFVLTSLSICFSIRHQTSSTFTASRAAVSSSPPAACLHHVLHKKVSKLKLLYTEDAQITKNSSQLLTLLTHYYKNLWSSTNHLWSSHHTSQTGREQSGVFTTEQLKPAVDLWVYTPHIQLWRDAGAHLEQTLPSVHTDVRGWETLTGTVVDDKHHQSEVKSQRVGGFMVIWRELLLHGLINTDETKQTVNNYIEKKQLPVSMCTCSVLINRVFLFPPESGRVSTLLYIKYVISWWRLKQALRLHHWNRSCGMSARYIQVQSDIFITFDQQPEIWSVTYHSDHC